jgi:predicted nucleic acid-binding protein
MQIALDTNILIGAEGFDEKYKYDQIIQILAKQHPFSIAIPAQCLLEMAFFLQKKRKLDWRQACAVVQKWSQVYKVIHPPPQSVQTALKITEAHGLQPFDAFILDTASENGCGILLSEDMQHGFVWRKTVIVNPFRLEECPLPHIDLAMQ